MRSHTSNQGWKLISRPLQFVLLVVGVICVAVTPRNLETVRAQSPHPGANVLAWQALTPARHISTSYQGSAATVAKLRSGVAPLAMASADFDGDGIADLVVGYAHSSGGILAVHRGNLDAFAPQSHASWLATAHGHSPAPFLPHTTLIDVPEAPQFIVTGDFTGNGDVGILIGARGSQRLYLLAGDGKGKFSAPQIINLPGALTALAAGQVGIREGRTDVVAGVQQGQTAAVLVYKGSASGLAPTPVSYSVPSPATQLEIADLHGDGLPDVAVLAGAEVLILHPTAQAGEDTSALLERVPAAGGARSIAVGGFVWDRKSRNQLAVLSPGGTVQVLSAEELDTRPFTEEERRIRRNPALRKKVPSELNQPWSGESHAWSVIKSASVSAPMSGNVRLMAAGLAHTRPVDLMVVDASDRRLHVLPANTSGDSADEAGELTVETGDAPVAVLPMRVNVDSRHGLVMLGGSAASPMTLTPQPNVSLCCTVNRLDDPPVALASAATYCNNVANDCSLRQAVIKSNSLTPTAQTINLPAGTYTLTIMGQGESQALTGDLDVTNSVSIVGSGSIGNPTSIITGGAGWNDKFISVNKMGTSNAGLSVSGVVFQNGNNTNLFSTNTGFDALGGAVAFYGCATIAGGCVPAGTPSLTITNVQFLNNSIGNGVTNGPGGGCSGGGNIDCGGGLEAQFGNVTISQSTFTGNKATNGRGGGLVLQGAIETMTVSNSTFTNNTSGIEGGGILIDFQDPGATGSVAIHSSTISNNTSGTFTAADGGGIFVNLARPSGVTPVETATASIDQKTVISGNTATNNRGGGIDFIGVHESPTINTSLTLSKVTITGNHSGASSNGGGGIYVPIGGTLNLQYSRIVGNTAPSGKPTGIGIEPSSTATINASDNWWGCNTGPSAAPCDTVGYTSGSSGSATITDTPYIILSLSASPTTLQPQPPGTTTSALTADFLHESVGTISLSNIDVLLGLPIAFNATNGTISGAQTTIQSNGTATANVSPNSSCVTPLVASATVDSGTPTVNITVDCPDLTASKANNVSGSVPLATGAWTWTITVQNSNAANSAPAQFTSGQAILSDTLPSGPTYGSATPGSFSGITNSANISCGISAGVLSCIASGATVTIGTGGSFQVSFGASNAAAGSYSNSCTVDPNNDVDEFNESNNACASNTVTVVAPPVIGKSFSPAGIATGATSSLTFTITNPTANTVGLTGVGFLDSLPSGMTVATSTSAQCGGTLTTTAPASIQLSSASIVTGGQCQFSVTVTGTTRGHHVNLTGNVNSTNGGTGNTATANLDVFDPPTISKSFGASSIPLNSSTTLSFTVGNPAGNPAALTGLSFTDGLPGGLLVSNPNGESGTCGGGRITATTGSGSVSLAGATLSAGTSCTFQVNVTGTTAGQQNNSVTITSNEGGTGNTGIASTLVVAPPGISKSFSPTTVPLGNDSTVTFVITNPNGGSGLSGLSFTDPLPGDLVVSTSPDVSNSCNGTVTATAGSGSISFSGGTLSNGGSCAISVNVTPGSATTYPNQTSPISSTEGGSGAASNATLTAVTPACYGPPSPGMVAWWPGEHNFTDISGGNNGTNTNTTFTTGEVGQAFNFDGTDAYFSVPDSASLDVPASPGLTFDMWLNPSQFGGTNTGYRLIFGKELITGQASYFAYLDPNGKLGIGFQNSTLNEFPAWTTTQPLSVNDWSHIAFVFKAQNFNSTDLTIYVNGAPVTTTFAAGNYASNFALAYSSNPLRVGGDPDNLVGGYFAGQLDELEFFNRQLTATEVQSLYLAGSVGKCKSNATISKSFLPTSVPVGTNSTLTFTIANPNSEVNLTGVAFNDTFPSGLKVASTPSPSNTCTGTFTTVANSGSVSLSGGTVAAGGSCALSVAVTSATAGSYPNTSDAISTNEAGTGLASNTATLTVVAPATISKAFSPTTISVNGTSTLTFTLGNTNAVSLTGVSFSDSFPAGLQVASVPNTSGTCTGSFTATGGAPSVSFGGGSMGPSSTCKISVDVTATTSGPKDNTTTAISSNEGGTGTPSNTAELSVGTPPTIQKSFTDSAIPLNGSTTLSFTITNPSANTTSVTGVGFTDTLPAGLIVSTPNNGLTNSCDGGTITAVAGSGSVSLSGATLGAGSGLIRSSAKLSPATSNKRSSSPTPNVPSTSSCTFSVSVTGTTTGAKNNSVTVNSDQGTGNTATATVDVDSPPTIQKNFGAASIELGEATSLSFVITNPNSTNTVNGIGFSDTLPAGLVITSPSNGLTGSCGGGTITATPNTNMISLSGASLPASGSCTFSVGVAATMPGTQNNVTGNVTSTEGGMGGTASASIAVVTAPTFTKAFNPAANTQPGDTSTLTITITNPSANSTALMGIGFTDPLPVGMVVATPNGLSNTCGGTATAVEGSGNVSLSGGTIATPGSSCAVTVNVLTTKGGTNTIPSVSSSNGGTQNNPATARLATCLAPPPNMIGWWPGNGNTNDVVNGNNGTWSGTSAYGAGKVGQAFSFSGSNFVTATGGSGSLNLTGTAVTIDGWVNPNTTGVSGVYFGKTQSGADDYLLYSSGGAMLAAVKTTGGEEFTGGTFYPPAGQWTHIAMTYDGVSIRLYANGALIQTDSKTGNLAGSNVPFDIGGRSGDLKFNGLVDEVEVFNRTLSGSEIADIYNAGDAGKCMPPAISKAFGASSVVVNGTTSLTFTITKQAVSTTADTGIAFTDTLPGGLVVATSNGLSSTCGGTATAVPGSTSISLSGGSITNPGDTCRVVANVTATQAGLVTNTTGPVSSTNGGNGAPGSANLSVATPPTIQKSFGAATIPLNGSTSLTFTITNPSANTTSLTGVGFTDTLPGGLVVATSNGLTGSCDSGTITAVAGSGSVSLSGATLTAGSGPIHSSAKLNAAAPNKGGRSVTPNSPGTSSCTFSVNVTGTTAGVQNNSVTVTSDQGTGNTSTASVTVDAPPTIQKSFGAASIPLNGSTTLSFTITNPNTSNTMTGIGFSDTLPAGLVISTPNGLTGSCGGTVTATPGSNTVSLSGGSLGAGSGPIHASRGSRVPGVAATGSCTFSVNVTGTTAGDKLNTSGNVTSTEGGTGGTASASTTVVAPPSIAKAFNPSAIALNGTTSLTFTITNPTGNTVSLTGVGFTDTLQTGLTVATSAATVCGGTLTTTNPTSIVLTGATIAANSQCQFSVTVTGAASGSYTNTTGNVTSTNGGTGNTASANLKVGTPPTIAKAFTPASIVVGGNSVLSFTISNSTSIAQTGVTFSDPLPSGVQVASSPHATNTCGGTFSAASGSTTVGLNGGSVAPNSSCALSVKVTGKTYGVKPNTTGVISSNEGGAGTTSNTATLTVIAPPTIQKGFGAASIPLGGSTSLGFTIGNPNTTTTLHDVEFSDSLPLGLVVSTPNGLTSSCGGTISATSGAKVINLYDATLAPGATCTISVNVTGTTPGTKNNVTSAITSKEYESGGTASASIGVVKAPSITKAFGGTNLALHSSVKLSFAVSNPAVNTVALTGVAFTDNLPSGLIVATPNDLMGSCGGGTITANAGSGTISLSGATLNVGSTCIFEVKVTATANGTHVNVTSSVTSTNGGTGNTATATISVMGMGPVIGTQPANQTVCEQTNVSFTASATGSPTPTVQWQMSVDGGSHWNNISGATSTTLTFLAVAGEDGNKYRAIFTNNSGSATTNAATLTVNTDPQITTQPVNKTVAAGHTATFTAAASGRPTPTVQWQVSTNSGGSWSNISGATSTTLSFTANASQNKNQYRAVFTNGCGTPNTHAAVLTVD